MHSSQSNMLLAIVLLFFSSESAVKCWTTLWPAHSATWNTVTNEAGVTETLSPLRVVATPSYPIVAGPTVDLHCSALTTPASVIWSWQRLEHLAWREVGRVNNLTLTEPGQSGLYRCSADTADTRSQSVSHNIAVFIIATQPTVTVGEKLGIAALTLSLLALTVALAILCLLVWQRFGDTLTTSNTAAKASPGPGKAPKGGSPQAESNGDVYMNYTGTNEAYSDLDPSNMTGDNLYSSLS